MADTDQVLNLAAIIRKVDGNHSKGAAALAESILDHPGFRAVLASEPTVPQGREPASVTGQPSDGEVAELTAWLRMQGEAQKPGPESLLSTKTKKEMHANGSRLIRAAELLERQVLVPVSVSEGLPGPEDCDAEGKCWWGRDESDDWYADWTLASHKAVAEFCGFSPQTVWLPAHALPLPEVGE